MFIFFNSIKPSFLMLIKNLKIDKDVWKRGFCPVCGKYPYFGIITKESEKIVECGLCGYQWNIERIFCPFCENKEQNKIKYFEDENDPQYRVYLCDECKRYLKTLNEENVDTYSHLEIEDVATLHLDLIAKERGYLKE
jgi:FdhE protein